MLGFLLRLFLTVWNALTGGGPKQPAPPPPSDFPKCLGFVWQFDGQKNDAAPTENFATDYGVTQYTWGTAQQRGMIPSNKPISQATKADCEKILQVMFYQDLGCDKMQAGVDLVVFNDGMGCGVEHAAKLVQRLVHVTEDGVIGPETLSAIEAMGAKRFIDAMHDADETYFAALKNAPIYLKGWDRREDEARTLAYQMAGITNA